MTALAAVLHSHGGTGFASLHKPAAPIHCLALKLFQCPIARSISPVPPSQAGTFEFMIQVPAVRQRDLGY
jgi:hypothetical protein